MKIECLHETPLTIAALAGKTCTATQNVSYLDRKEVETFLGKLIERGHESVIEHIVYTFRAEGITRALLQELARHRHISLSVKSTRWALKKTATEALADCLNFAENLPVAFEKKGDADAYAHLLESFEEYIADLDSVLARKAVPNDVLKYFVPECLKTDLVFTVNARELRHIFKLRTAPNALAEFRELCYRLFAALPVTHDFMYGDCCDDWLALRPRNA